MVRVLKLIFECLYYTSILNGQKRGYLPTKYDLVYVSWILRVCSKKLLVSLGRIGWNKTVAIPMHFAFIVVFARTLDKMCYCGRDRDKCLFSRCEQGLVWFPLEYFQVPPLGNVFQLFLKLAALSASHIWEQLRLDPREACSCPERQTI